MGKVVVDQLFHGPCVGLWSLKVEQVSMKTVADADSVYVIKIHGSLLAHHAKRIVKCVGAGTSLFHSVGNC